MARPSETAQQVDIGPDEIVKSNSCSNGSYMNDVSLSDLPKTAWTSSLIYSILLGQIQSAVSDAAVPLKNSLK